MAIPARRGQLSAVASYGVLLHAALETARISVPTVYDALLGRTDYTVCSRRLDAWSRRLVENARLTIATHGRENLDPELSYVVMSNHQSNYDIPVLFQGLKVPIRMIAKTELFRIPIFGRAMLDSGFVELDRKNRRRALQSMDVAKQRLLRDKLSIWIAPEGTRSRTGELGPFKTGGFHLALSTGAPILPVTIRGTIDVLRSGDDRVHKGRTVHLDVHEAIDPAGFGRTRMKDLIALVRERIASTLPEHLRGSG